MTSEIDFTRLHELRRDGLSEVEIARVLGVGVHLVHAAMQIGKVRGHGGSQFAHVAAVNARDSGRADLVLRKF